MSVYKHLRVRKKPKSIHQEGCNTRPLSDRPMGSRSTLKKWTAFVDLAVRFRDKFGAERLGRLKSLFYNDDIFQGNNLELAMERDESVFGRKASTLVNLISILQHFNSLDEKQLDRWLDFADLKFVFENRHPDRKFFTGGSRSFIIAGIIEAGESEDFLAYMDAKKEFIRSEEEAASERADELAEAGMIYAELLELVTDSPDLMRFLSLLSDLDSMGVSRHPLKSDIDADVWKAAYDPWMWQVIPDLCVVLKQYKELKRMNRSAMLERIPAKAYGMLYDLKLMGSLQQYFKGKLTAEECRASYADVEIVDLTDNDATIIYPEKKMKRRIFSDALSAGIAKMKKTLTSDTIKMATILKAAVGSDIGIQIPGRESMKRVTSFPVPKFK